MSGDVVSEPVRARRLRIRKAGGCCRSCGAGSTVGRLRRAMIIMASASGTLVPAIARLVAADEDTVRDVIHAVQCRRAWPRWTLGGRAAVPPDQ